MLAKRKKSQYDVLNWQQKLVTCSPAIVLMMAAEQKNRKEKGSIDWRTEEDKSMTNLLLSLSLW